MLYRSPGLPSKVISRHAQQPCAPEWPDKYIQNALRVQQVSRLRADLLNQYQGRDALPKALTGPRHSSGGPICLVRSLCSRQTSNEYYVARYKASTRQHDVRQQHTPQDVQNLLLSCCSSASVLTLETRRRQGLARQARWRRAVQHASKVGRAFRAR